jgi:hypothetical protein
MKKLFSSLKTSSKPPMETVDAQPIDKWMVAASRGDVTTLQKMIIDHLITE